MPKSSSGFIVVILCFLTGLCSPPVMKAQTISGTPSVPDSVMEKLHSPKKASIMSALLPGLGQIYNKKYWKVPVLYAGFGIMTYFIVTNAQDYVAYKGAYIEKSNGDTTGKYADLVNKYTAENLQSAREYYRRNLEISVLVTALWYILNIVDASVDAHLFTYNISKDLTLKVEPAWFKPFPTGNNHTGIKLSLRF